MHAIDQFINLLRDDKGATAIEYALIASLIVIAIIGALNTFADESNAMWGKVETAVQGAVQPE